MKTFTQWLESWIPPWESLEDKDRDRDREQGDEYVTRHPHNPSRFLQIDKRNTTEYEHQGPKPPINIQNKRTEFIHATIEAAQNGLNAEQIIHTLQGEQHQYTTPQQAQLLNIILNKFKILKKRMPLDQIFQIVQTVVHQTHEAPLHEPTPEELAKERGWHIKLAQLQNQKRA